MSKEAGVGGGQAVAPVVPIWLQVMIGLVALSGVGMLIKYLATFGVATSPSQEVWGQFGDFFGGILNPLLSSLTLAAVLVTMRLQSKELKIAQEENKRANEHLEKQANYIRIQNFESVFFRLLDVHMDSRSNVCIGTTTGKEAFDILVRKTSPCFRLLALTVTAPDEISMVYYSEDFRKRIGDALNVYCRGMYQVIKYVDTYEGFTASNDLVVESKVENTTSREKMQLRREQDKAYRPMYFAKRQYINMLRAQLTPAELKMLYLSCLTEEGVGLKYLAEKYSLFKGLGKWIAEKPEFANDYYSYLAFADYEDIQIRDVRLLDAQNERMSMKKRRHISAGALKNKLKESFVG
ncbi:putative phage abortive infection protein [Pseudomonas cremoris]|uniref:putative phage abortive infection protein n=1 Tax=Pseudomonas cremoris TaxID=2724178 RepID=UPI00289DDEC2|nr:putative phage abortive infection protein [Pseudomonas cremoris]